jgi:hypothetical protein
MAYKGFLKIAMGQGTRAFTLVECEYQFHREVNENGTPKGGVTGGRIIATVVTPQKNLFMYKWLFEEKLENGFVEINNSQNEPHYIMFERARCVDIYEYFNGHSKDMMISRLTIQCPEMGFYGFNEDSFAYDFRLQFSRTINPNSYAGAISREDYMLEAVQTM